VRLESDSWRRFLDSYERTAFRLETLPSYGVPEEDAELAAFLSTGTLDIPDDDQWLVRVREFRATGRWVGRVHVVRRPLTDYLRYEFAVYAHTVRAGEDVRILDVTDDPEPGLPQQDFWLLDDTRIVLMIYDGDGRRIGRELLDDVDPAPYVRWKRRAWERAVPFTEYRAMLDG
jgi:hypothetical protein